MAASSEIQYKITGNTTSLKRSFAEIPGEAKKATDKAQKEMSRLEIFGKTARASIGSVLDKKFGFKDAIKGVFQGIGIGSVDAITTLVVAPFQRGAEQAKAMAALTGDLFANTLRWTGVLGGPTRELENQVRQANELTRDIAAQRQLIADLNANPLNLITAGGRAALTEAEAGLNELIKKQAELTTDVQIAVLQENRRTAALQRSAANAESLANIELQHGIEARVTAEKLRQLREEYNVLVKEGALPSVLQANRNEQAALENAAKIARRNTAEKIADIDRAANAQEEAAQAELRDAGDLEKLYIRLNALRYEGRVIASRTGANSPEAAANLAERNAVNNQIALLQKTAAAQQSATLSGLGQSVAGTRTGGRSEAQRLADRGASRLSAAQAAAMSGTSPAYVAALAAQANRDFKTAGGKVSTATSGVAKSDSNDLGNQLIAANQTLKAIEKNLAPTKVPLR